MLYKKQESEWMSLQTQPSFLRILSLLSFAWFLQYSKTITAFKLPERLVIQSVGVFPVFPHFVYFKVAFAFLIPEAHKEASYS